MNYQIPLRKIPAQAVAFSIANQTLNITLRQIKYANNYQS